jgi:hypothetical protein
LGFFMKNIFGRKVGVTSVGRIGVLLTLVLATITVPRNAAAQDQQYDDPPSRVARLGYMEGSVSFDPAGQQDWVEATPNRPMTTGDKLWADKDSRAELQLGSASIRLSANTGMSFLNLDDRTVQIQLTSGVLNVRVRRLNRDDVFEIDTPNQAFSVYQPGSYRLEASEDGSYTVISVREGQGESTGNGETFTLHRGQRGTFSGTERLNAEVDNIAEPDQFDNWAYQREHRYEGSRSAHYLSPDVVGYEDLDDNGDWRDDSNYGHVWFPSHVEADWAPYHNGHWAWVAPWGWTWVDDAPWGYAPFHYGRWVSVSGRWGWVAGPVDVVPVYAPALVVFVGGGIGVGVDVGWFPLGPREVYVPTYNVSREYVNRVNISNTTVNTTTVTNVYNTTIVNNNNTTVNNTTVNKITYANRSVPGAVTAVPQHAFVSAQPVAKAAVKVDARQMASAPVMTRVAVAPSRESVLGVHANTANHVTAPSAAVANRQVIAKNTPPPPPVPFAKQQQMMAAHPGVPPARHELRAAQPANTAQAHPMVKMAPPGKPTEPNTGQPGNQPGNQPNASRPGQPGSQPNARPGMPANQPPANQPGNRPGNPPAPNEHPGTTSPAQPNRPEANRPPTAQPNNRPEPNQPNRPEANRPPAAPPDNRPEPNQLNRPEANRPPAAQPNRPEPNRPPAAQPNNRPEPNQPNRPEANRPPAAQPNRPEPNRPPAAQPNNRPEPNQPNRPEASRPPAAQPNRPEPNRPPAAQPNRPEPNQPNRPEPNQPNRPEANRPPAAQPKPEPQRQQAAPQRTPPPAETRPASNQQQKPETPQEKKKREQEQQKPPGM